MLGENRAPLVSDDIGVAGGLSECSFAADLLEAMLKEFELFG